MMKILWPMIVLTFLAGCTWQDKPVHRSGEVTVLVSADGMNVGGAKLASTDLPAFAKEVGGREVIIAPLNAPDFAKLLEAKKTLEDAGVKQVRIRGVSGG